MQTNYFSGSTWSKWDLHVHTPYSIVNDYKSNESDVWEKYISALEKLENIKVLGINDYWFIDGYKKVIGYKNKGRLKNIDLILPVIELRLEYLVGNSNLNKINYHVIFSNELAPEEIEEEFIKKIEIPNLDNKSLTKDNLIKYGKKIIKETPDNKKTNKSCLQVGFDNFAVSLDKVEELLSKKLFQGKYLTAIGKTEWEEFRWDGSSDIKKTLINKADLIFTASPNIEQFYKSKQKFIDNQVNDLLVHCSDAHQFPQDKNTKSKKLGHCFTWIKAKPTFEGLKQIIYEPKYRLKISENKPSNPIHFIKSVTLKFKDGIKFNNNTFCFSGTKKTIYFSSNLTCIIGGRGSGKSTILNLIAKKLNILENKDFFSDLEGINEQKLLNSIEVELDGLNNVEYLAQNTIEQFATNTLAFSGAIFERLNKLSNDNLKKLEDEISNDLKLFDKQIKQLKIRYDKHKKLKKLKESLRNYENIVNTFNDEEYTSEKDELQKLQKQYTELSNSIKRLHSFLEVVYEVSTQEPFYILESPIYTSRNDYECNVLKEEELNIVKEPKNEFDKLYNITLKKVQKIYQEIFESEEYKKGSQRLQELKEQYEILKKEIHDYLLKEKRIKEDSIQDIQTANENIEKLKLEIKKLKKEILSIKKDINAFSHKKIDENIKKFKDEIQEQLKKSNKILENIANKNEDVKKIEIKFNLYDGIFDIVFKEFEKELDLYEEIRSYREIFKTYLKEIGINEILNLNINNELISLIEQKHKDTKTFGKIKTVFENNTSFLILKTLIEKHQRNIKNNKRFIIYYDNRNIKNSSFGQKCTAVIIIMLLLGNNPIIIDEPEAHLDSSLIANYLVDLIKEVKQDRQIIFATHNANFVLNGDAELIIKLENDNTTTFKSFVIEDIGYRKDLLKLEGGKEAFKMRESKYGI